MTAHPPRIAVLTSGGDAPGMNAAVRAAVRAGIERGAHVFGILEGWQGAVDGGRGIRRLGWDDVAGILHRGGTVLGTARCLAFRERAGMRQAAFHLVQHRIDRVVVIGGDGSLAGAAELAQLWPELLAELVASGDLEQEQADAHPRSVRPDVGGVQLEHALVPLAPGQRTRVAQTNQADADCVQHDSLHCRRKIATGRWRSVAGSTANYISVYSAPGFRTCSTKLIFPRLQPVFLSPADRSLDQIADAGVDHGDNRACVDGCDPVA